jgi:multidrug efflux system membrane fusion protein
VRRRLKLLLITVSAVAIGYIAVRYQSASYPGHPTASATSSAVPATVAQAETRDVPVWLSGIGSVSPLNAVIVKVRVDGQLDRVLVAEGQDVHAGDVLAQIDPRPYQASLDQALAKKAQDQASLANARIDLARYQKLVAKAYTTAQQADTQKATVAQLEAQVAQDQAAIAMAQLQLDFTTIRAPLDGRVGIRLVDPGSIVHASDLTGIVTVTQMQPINVLFALPQDDLPRITTAMAAGDVTVAAYSRDGDRMLVQGKLVFIDSQVDAATGQIKFKALFDNTDRILWPGQFVTVRVLVNTIRQAVVVPAEAIEQGQNGTYVFRLTRDDIVEVRQVKLGPVTAPMAIVSEGLSPRDRVVIGGQFRLKPGVRVAPQPATVTSSS